MAREHGFVYYEVDVANCMINPFPDLHSANPTGAAFHGNPVKFTREDMKAHLQIHSLRQRFGEEQTLDCWNEVLGPMTEIVCKNILRQKERLGGDFAACHATPSRIQRDFIRKCLGPHVVFVVLSLSKECQEKRLRARESDEGSVTFLTDLYDFYEQAGGDEPDAVNVFISEDMSAQDVVKDVLRKINYI